MTLDHEDAFRYRLDVRFFEVDSLGVVFNMWYFGWCDEAMSAFMESIGFGYATLRAEGFDAVLRKAEVEWLQSLEAFQQAEIAVRVDHVGSTSFRLSYDIERVQSGAEAGEPVQPGQPGQTGQHGQPRQSGPSRTLCVRAAITYVCVQISDRNKAPIPADLREILMKNHA